MGKLRKTAVLVAGVGVVVVGKRLAKRYAKWVLCQELIAHLRDAAIRRGLDLHAIARDGTSAESARNIIGSFTVEDFVHGPITFTVEVLPYDTAGDHPRNSLRLLPVRLRTLNGGQVMGVVARGLATCRDVMWLGMVTVDENGSSIELNLAVYIDGGRKYIVQERLREAE